MNPPNKPKLARTAYPTPKVRAYIGEAGGGAPTAGDESSDWEVAGWSRHAGSTPDTIRLIRKMTDFIFDRHLQSSGTREVEVWLLNDEGERLLPLAWGETTGQALQISDGGESEQLVATIERWHYGNVLDGETVWDKEAEEIIVQHVDARFQPRIDNRITNNRSKENEVDDTQGEGKHYLWVDPESSRTPAAYAEHYVTLNPPFTEVPDAWTLPTAIETLMQVLNPAETFISNAIVRDPDSGDALPLFDEAIEPDNVVLKRGRYLPEYLDAVLQPRGYNWRVDVTEEEDTADSAGGNDGKLMQRKIVIFKRGEGPKKSLRLQEPGSTLDPLKSSLQQASINVTLASLANRIVAHGSLQQREVTIELERGWSEDDDDLTVVQLTRGDSSQFESKPEVHRLWIANEAGDYTESRPEITEVLDLSSVGTDDAFKLPKRRPLDVPLTYRGLLEDQEEGLRRPVKVEWREDSSFPWKEIDWPFSPLEDECGVYFNGTKPPSELIDNANVELRVTGTITGDQAYEAIAEPTGDSVVSSSVTLLLDVSDRFHNRARQTDGDFKSKLTGAHDERDDDANLDTFVTSVQTIEDVAGIQATITQFGLRNDIEIGDLIEDIDGRSVVLNRTANEDAEPRYLQMVGITYDYLNQTTSLQTEAYDGAV